MFPVERNRCGADRASPAVQSYARHANPTSRPRAVSPSANRISVSLSPSAAITTCNMPEKVHGTSHMLSTKRVTSDSSAVRVSDTTTIDMLTYP